MVNDAADDLHALDPDRGITCGQVVLQAGSDMEHPSRLAFQPGTMPDITLTGDASRLRQEHCGHHPSVHAGRFPG